MLGGNDVCLRLRSWQPSTTDVISVSLLGRDKLPVPDADALQGRGTEICVGLELQYSGRRTSGWSRVLAEIQAQHDIHFPSSNACVDALAPTVPS